VDRKLVEKVIRKPAIEPTPGHGRGDPEVRREEDKNLEGAGSLGRGKPKSHVL
jgi:hypothetical protein